jgi:hypothetical protein
MNDANHVQEVVVTLRFALFINSGGRSAVCSWQ